MRGRWRWNTGKEEIQHQNKGGMITRTRKKYTNKTEGKRKESDEKKRRMEIEERNVSEWEKKWKNESRRKKQKNINGNKRIKGDSG